MSHFTCPHCHQEIDIFSKGGAERTAKQFNLQFLGSIELDPEIRQGGDKGLPVALLGETSAKAKDFYSVARKVAKLAQEQSAKAENVFEIS
jgi:ATP-binding protein involved in chromosome partitioning